MATHTRRQRNSQSRQILVMVSSWKRSLKAIVPYFHLLGNYAWLKFENNQLKGVLMEVGKHLEVNNPEYAQELRKKLSGRIK